MGTAASIMGQMIRWRRLLEPSHLSSSFSSPPFLGDVQLKWEHTTPPHILPPRFTGSAPVPVRRV